MRQYFRCFTIIAVAMTMCLAFFCSASFAATGYQGAAYEDLFLKPVTTYEQLRLFDDITVKKAGLIGKKIPGVVIKFVSENGRVVSYAITDNSGAYRIDLPVGRYVVTTQHPDYEDYSSAPGFFVVTGRAYSTGNFFLKRKLITTILLIRHADKEDPSSNPDPPLTALGQARATELVHAAGKAGVKAIYATETLRSKQTVQPLAASLSLPITTYNGYDYAALKNNVLSNHAGKVIVVAGHAETLSEITKVFGGDVNKCTVNGNEFDNLCVITVYQTGKASVVNLQYGATSP